ncbi:MAG: ATP-binding cassette domain-containing protein [Bacteriovoracaceae bacterium]|nr:ATP-binding cassette domain-containing protein [Bacteriovoracaceae bacterium]
MEMTQIDLRSKNHPLKSYQYYLDNVSVQFGKTVALKNLKFIVNTGEVLFLTGASGAGKTTLLRLLAGEIAPTSGELKTMPAADNFVGRVFQDLRLVSNLTCEENLYFSFDNKIYKSVKQFRDEMDMIAKALGVYDRLNTKIVDCNGGLKQKVAMMRALLAHPTVLLADEPTSALDKTNAAKLFDVLSFYNSKKSMTVVWASHNRELVKQFPGKILNLEAGRMVYAGNSCFI